MGAPAILILAGLATAGIVATSGGTASGAGKPAKKAGPNRRLLRAYGETLELTLTWPGLADFLDATAYTESRWSPRAGASKVGTNGAIGAYQFRPNSAFTKKEWGWNKAEKIAHGELLLDPLISTAAAVDYLRRVHAYPGANGATMGSLRASLAYPNFVGGRSHANNKSRYDKAIRNFVIALGKAGLPASFASQAAYPAGWGGSWRQGGGGMQSLITLLGGVIPQG